MGISKKLKLIIILVPILIVVLPLILWKGLEIAADVRFAGGIGANFVITLQNDYELWVCNSTQALIGLPNRYGGAGLIVGDTIKALNTKGPLIFGTAYEDGKLEKGIYIEGAFKGYFILDTKTGKRFEKLKKEEWLGTLNSYGIDKEPELIHPSAFFNLMRNK